MTTPFQSLPELEPSQSQPEVIVNRDVRALEASVSIEVIDKDLATPPASPASTARYLIPKVGATGAWAGLGNRVAYLQGTTWFTLQPFHGWIVMVRDEGVRYEYDADADEWVEFSAGGGSIAVSGPDESPPVSVPAVTSLEFINSIVEDLGGGAVRVTSLGGGGSAENGHGVLTAVGISSNTINIDHSLGADFTLSLTDNVATVNHNNVAPGEANWFTLRIAQDGTGGRTFAPPASWVYPSGVSAYTPSSGANDVDLVQGVSYDDGTSWHISYERDYA